MPIDFRPTELDIRCKEETSYSMSITHRRTGTVVAGNGPHKFRLECDLLQRLREKMESNDGRS